MATSIIKNNQPIIRTININYSVTANGGTWSTNLKTLIDNDLPQGYKFGGIAGWTTNQQRVFVVACDYVDNQWSFQVTNEGSTIQTKEARVRYIAIPI